jgi:hypothetical protein
MADVNEPIINGFLNDVVRPRNERMRFTLDPVTDLVAWYDQHIAPTVGQYQDADIIIDGRADDVQPMTIGQLKKWVALQRFLVLLNTHRGNETQNQLQNGFNAFVNENINVQQLKLALTVRRSLFGD